MESKLRLCIKYLIEVTGRLDATSKFPPEKRYGFFPGVSAGWRLSEESFFKNSRMGALFSNMKLRGSYGMMGNASPGNYSAFDYLDGYNYNSGSLYSEGKLAVGTVLRNPGITNISWAKAYIYDLGIDIASYREPLQVNLMFSDAI
jgi:hypothetical protein